MVPKEFRKSLCVVAGWVTLLEAILWVAVAIFSIGVFGCAWDFIGIQNGVSSWSMLYTTYFMGQCKGSVGASALGYSFTPPTDSARSLQVWMWIYAIASAVWIPTCILLIVAAVGEVRGRHGALLYYPWIGLTALLVVLDLAGTIFHLVDISKTTTPDDYAKFSTSNTASTWSGLTSSSSTLGITTWLPSLYITLLFCRFVVFWILNIALVYWTYKASDAVSLYKTKFIQNTPTSEERKRTWKNIFYQGPEPTVIEQQPRNATTNTQITEEMQQKPSNESQQEGEGELPRRGSTPVRYIVDEHGIPIEEVNPLGQREADTEEDDSFPRLPYQPTGRVYDHTGRPVRTESLRERWQESALPTSSGVQVPPELINKDKPFSYIAGDQPQLMRQVSRSSSKAEYPPIPRPDYTVADRRSASLEFVPNRFKVPTPKRPLQSQNSFNYDSSGDQPQSPKSPKIAPIPPKKPQVFPRSTIPRPEQTTQARYIPQQAIPSQQLGFITRQTSQSNNYNINRLY